MRSRWRRLYWAVLIVFSFVLGYESLARQLYGDNSLYWAVVFFGIAAFSTVRLASTRRGATEETT